MIMCDFNFQLPNTDGCGRRSGSGCLEDVRSEVAWISGEDRADEPAFQILGC